MDVRVVPYDTPAEVSDGGPTYRELWARGCFDDQLVAGHRLKVLMNFEHERGVANVVGKGVALHSEPDGLRGSFEILRTQAGDTALELIRDGILDGVSLEAFAKKSVRGVDGVVRRVKAHLRNVAICRMPAFKDAVVLAVREEVIMDEQLMPLEIDPDLVERCKKLGIKLPQRLAADTAEVLVRAFTQQAWDGAASRFADAAAYCRSCVIDDNPAGQPKVEANCHLPIHEPNGDVNINAVRNALARLDQVQTSADNKARARRMLERMLSQFNNQRQ